MGLQGAGTAEAGEGLPGGDGVCEQDPREVFSGLRALGVRLGRVGSPCQADGLILVFVVVVGAAFWGVDVGELRFCVGIAAK